LSIRLPSTVISPLSLLIEAGDRPQQRRLAAARRPEQREELAGLDGQLDIVERVTPGYFLVMPLDRRGPRPSPALHQRLPLVDVFLALVRGVLDVVLDQLDLVQRLQRRRAASRPCGSAAGRAPAPRDSASPRTAPSR
jgi:hypothetical protein